MKSFLAVFLYALIISPEVTQVAAASLVPEWGAHHYEAVIGRTSWEEADADAKARGGHLVTVTSLAEWTAIKDFVNGFQSSIPHAIRSFPLGLVHEVWQTGEPLEFKDWAVGFPFYVPAYGLWAYASGGADHRWKTVYGAGFYFEFYIVEKNSQRPPIVVDWHGHTYELILGHFTYEETLTDAHSRGGYLVAPTTAEERDRINSFVNSSIIPVSLAQRTFPIGLTRDRVNHTHHWVTGEPFSFADWGTRSPNYQLDFGDWVYASGGADHRWNTPYTKDYFFLVYVLEKANAVKPPAFVNVQIYPAVEIVFQTEQGEQYQVQISDAYATWSNMGDIIVGDGNLFHSHLQARDRARYYRVMIFPRSNSGLVVYYPLDGNGLDAGGGKHHALVHNAIGATDRFGKANNSLFFNGNAYLEAAVDGLPLLNQPRTLTAWLRPQDNGFIPGIVHQGNEDCEGKMFGIGMAYGHAFFWGGCQDFETSKLVPDNIWTFIAIKYGSSRITVHVNDQIETIEIGTLATLPSSLFIGAETLDNGRSFRRYFHGSIDEVRVYNRELSASEILKLYNQVK